MLIKRSLCCVMAFVFLFTAVVTGSINSVVLAEEPAGDTLLSGGKPTKASSVQDQNIAANANDGNMETRWTAVDPSFPQWWRVDLGAKCTLSKIDIKWFRAAERNYKYKIEVSDDDKSYTSVADKTGNTGKGDTSDAVTASGRYVKVTVTAGDGYASFFECEVYGTQAAAEQTTSANQDGASGIPGDVKGTPYEQAIGTLMALKLLKGSTDGTFKPEENITRAEFAAILVSLLGLGNMPLSKEDAVSFNDVQEDHKGISDIRIAYNRGLISGYGDGSFGPEDPVTYEQAVKMLVSALGYDMMAQSQGGYPSGYLSVAAQLGVTKRVTVTDGGYVKRGDMALMAYNCLDVDLMQRTGFGNMNQYDITPDKTLLTEKFDIQKKKGRITGNEFTQLENDSILGSGEVEIDGKVYQAGTTGAGDLLGCYVTYYYKEDELTGNDTLLYVELEKGKNDILMIKADDIQDYKDKIYSYWIDKEKDENIKKAKVSSTADIIYNGQVLSVYDDEKLKPKAGNVRLLDSDNNGVYDVVFVTAYTNYVVHNFSDNTVYDKYDQLKKLDLDPESKSVKYFIKDKDGKAVDPEEIKEWIVLTVAESQNLAQDKILYNIIYVNNPVEGKVSEILNEQEAGKKKIKINDSEYSIARNYTEDIQLDDEGTFYLDAEGKIAAVQKKAQGGLFGYVIDALILNKGLDKRVTFKLFNQEKKILVLKGAEQVDVDGEKYESNDIITALKKNSATVNQLVKYESNAEGELSSIDTADTYDNSTKDGLLVKKLTTSTKYKSSAMTFSGMVNISSGTLVFRIPNRLTDVDYFAVYNSGYYANDSSYTFSAYFTKKDALEAEAVVQMGDDSQNIADDTEIMYVTKITHVTNKDGSSVEKVYFYKGGNETNYLTTTAFSVINQGIEPGDAVRFNLTVKNEIENAEKVFDAGSRQILVKNVVSAQKFYRTPSADYATKYFVVYGDVYARANNVIKVTADNLDTFNYKLDKSKIYIYDSSKDINKRLFTGTVEDIIDKKHSTYLYSRVFMYLRDGEVKSVLILK